MDQKQFSQYAAKVFNIGLSRETLTRLFALCGNHKRIALIGWSDYAKHLINVLDGRAVSVIDNDPELRGITFRGVAVQQLADAPRDLDAYVLTRFDYLNEYMRALTAIRQYPAVPYLYAEDYHGQSSAFLNPMLHDPAYRGLADAGPPPPTMMNGDRLILLLEMLRVALHHKGAVAEVGVWQGGSVWHLCQALLRLNELRTVFAFDLFDDADRLSGRAIMAEDEIRRPLGFYPAVEIVRGDVRKTMTRLDKEKLCFVHFDNQYQATVIPYLWQRLVPGGVMLLDNYGHVRSLPAFFDHFFAAQGVHVAFIPPLGQGLVIKPQPPARGR